MIRFPVRPVVFLALAGMGMAGAILGDGSDQWLTMIFLLWGVGAVVFAFPLLGRIRLPARRRTGSISVTELRQDPFTAFWLRVEIRIPHIRRMREAYADYLRRMGSGLTYDHDLHARWAIHLFFSMLPLAAVPVATGEAATAAVAMAPMVVLYPWMQLWGRVRKHAVQVEEEMSFFLCYLATMQGVGYTLYTALDRMRDAPDVFIAIARDAATVTTNVALGASQMEALREYAARHPVQAFKDFLYGYISKHETVGPVPSYTEAKSEQFFETYKQTWKNYKETALMLAAMAVMVSLMIPIMMVMTIFISTQAMVNMVLSMGPMLGPVFAMLLMFMVNSAQPSTGVKLKPWLPSIGVGVGAALLVHFLWLSSVPGGDIWDTEPGVTVSMGFVAGGLANYLMVRRQLGGASNVDRGLPEFLEDVYQQTLSGSGMTAILRQQAKAGVYTGLFARIIRGIVSKLDTGATMEDACQEARKHSRYLAFVLFIIVRLQDIGSISPPILQQMTRFMANIVTTKLDVEKSLRMGAIMIYVSPLMLIGIMNGMFSVFEGGGDTSVITNMLPPGAMDSFQPPDPDAGYKQRLGMMAALLTCPMGLVAAKITKFTAVNTLPLVIVGLINMVSIIFIPILLVAFMG